MFPSAHSRIYYNEAGEVIGWDNPQYDEPPEPDDGFEEYYRDWPDMDDCDHSEVHETDLHCLICGCCLICPNCHTEDSIEVTAVPGMAGWASPLTITRCTACDYQTVSEAPYVDGDEFL